MVRKLEDLVFPELYVGYKRFGESVGLLESVKKDPYNPSIPGDLIDYVVDYEGISPRDANLMVQDLAEKPTEKRRVIERRAVSNQNELVKIVSENYAGILDELPEDQLVALAVGVPDKDKKYLKIDNYAKKGDINSIRKILAEVYESPIWKDFVMGASQDFLGKYIQLYRQDGQIEFINEKLSDKTEEEKDGKKEVKYTPNLRKIKDYLVDSIKDLEDNKDLEGKQIRKMRNPIYLQTAEAYYQLEQKKIDDEEEDETDEKREKEMKKPEKSLFNPVGEEKQTA